MASGLWRLATSIAPVGHPHSCLQMALVRQSSSLLPVKGKEGKGRRPSLQKALGFLSARDTSSQQSFPLIHYHNWATLSRRNHQTTLVSQVLRCFPPQWLRQPHLLSGQDTGTGAMCSRHHRRCRNILSELECNVFLQNELRYILAHFILKIYISLVNKNKQVRVYFSKLTR